MALVFSFGPDSLPVPSVLHLFAALTAEDVSFRGLLRRGITCTNPLALDPQLVIEEHANDYAMGVSVLAKFDLPVYICQAPKAKLPEVTSPNVKTATFEGPHPAGLTSTHVHYISPVNGDKQVWSLGYQDVIAIGKLF